MVYTVVLKTNSFSHVFGFLSMTTATCSSPHDEDQTHRERAKTPQRIHEAIGNGPTSRPFRDEATALPSSSALHESSSAIAAGGYDSGKSQTPVGNFGTLTQLRHGDECSASDCRVLITGCGRSGTHFLTEQLAGAGMSER